MGGSEWQLFLKGLEGKTTVLRIHKDATVKELLSLVSKTSGISTTELRVLYAGKELRGDDPERKLMTDYRIEDQANLFLVLRLKGGSTSQEEEKELDDLVERTTARDMITWDDDPNNLRAKMPCGHAIGPESLTAFCKSLLDVNKFRFHCPYIDPNNHSYCGKEWEYFIVRRYAVLTDEEKTEFETKISQNYLNKACGVQECPSCHSLCERICKTDRRVICPLCTKKKGVGYEFCWYCLGEWRSSGTDKCGNSACSNEDPRLKILRDAPKKEIVGVKNCPSRRACIKCGMLIEHQKACKHMVCVCGQRFCFICLSSPVVGSYQCGTYNSACAIAAIQTMIPGSE